MERIKARTTLALPPKGVRGYCRLWQGAKVNGYGSIRDTELRKQVLVHRWVYQQVHGPLAPGVQLDHLCRRRHCWNVKHLEPVTCRENLRRGNTRAAVNLAKTHCPQGHEYSPENTYVYKNGARACRVCLREHARRYYHQRKGA